jgi:hypothetical protein
MTRDLEIQNSKRKDAKGFKIPDTRALRERDFDTGDGNI